MNVQHNTLPIYTRKQVTKAKGEEKTKLKETTIFQGTQAGCPEHCLAECTPSGDLPLLRPQTARAPTPCHQNYNKVYLLVETLLLNNHSKGLFLLLFLFGYGCLKDCTSLSNLLEAR